MINEIIYMIEKKIRLKGSCLVAIDGRCGSGKTTFSEILKTYFDCNVIHMDDFFLPPYLRSKERLEEAGGNVDYERFYKDVLCHLVKRESFSYRPFSCKTGAFTEPVEVKSKKVTFVEGTYCCHPSLFDAFDLHVFLDTEKAVQQERINKREGEEKLKVFNEKWIPLEEKYFFETELKYKCEIYCKV